MRQASWAFSPTRRLEDTRLGLGSQVHDSTLGLQLTKNGRRFHLLGVQRLFQKQGTEVLDRDLGRTGDGLH